jgi:tetratricopeptide (TPR) repeat protein
MKRKAASTKALGATLALVVVLGGARTALATDPPGTEPPTGSIAPQPGGLDRERALELYEQASGHYQRGDFRRAAVLLREAWGLAKEPVLLYNLARACENAGYLMCAAESYEQYLRIEKDLQDEAGLRRRLAVLHEQIAERDAAARPSAAPWVIAGIGLLGMGAALATGLIAADRHDEAEAESVHAKAFDLQAEAEALALGSTVTWVAASIVHATGLVWGAIDLATLGSPRDATADIAIGPGVVRLELHF